MPNQALLLREGGLFRYHGTRKQQRIGRRGGEMTANHRNDARRAQIAGRDSLEVAHITGVQGIRAAMETLAREAAANGEGATDAGAAEPDGAAGAPGAAGSADAADAAGFGPSRADGALPTVAEEVPLGRRTCAVCAADNDGSRETCWNCGASLRRAR